MPISEKTVELNYTTAVTAELLAITGKRVSVWAPTLQQEAQLGYDARMDAAMGVSLYVQYKRAVWRARTQSWKFSLNDTADEDQHAKLVQRANWCTTRYCLPLFNSYNIIRQYVGTRAFMESPHVFWLDPRRVPMPNNGRGRHSVYITRNAPHQLTLHSNPQSFDADGRFKTTMRELSDRITGARVAEEVAQATASRPSTFGGRITTPLRDSSEDSGGRGPTPPDDGHGSGGDGAGTGLVGFILDE